MVREGMLGKRDHGHGGAGLLESGEGDYRGGTDSWGAARREGGRERKGRRERKEGRERKGRREREQGRGKGREGNGWGGQERRRGQGATRTEDGAGGKEEEGCHTQFQATHIVHSQRKVSIFNLSLSLPKSSAFWQRLFQAHLPAHHAHPDEFALHAVNLGCFWLSSSYRFKIFSFKTLTESGHTPQEHQNPERERERTKKQKKRTIACLELRKCENQMLGC